MDLYSFKLSGSDKLANYVDLVYIYIQDFDWSSEYLTGNGSRFRSAFLTRRSTFTVYFCGASSRFGVADPGRIISSCLVKDIRADQQFTIKVNNVQVGSVSINRRVLFILS
jgi:hypothetical protein